MNFGRWWSKKNFENDPDFSTSEDEIEANGSEETAEEKVSKSDSNDSNEFLPQSEPEESKTSSENEQNHAEHSNCAKRKQSIWSCLIKGPPSEEEIVEEEKVNGFLVKIEREIKIAEKEVIASSVSSAFSTFISHPFDTIKWNYLSLRYPKDLSVAATMRRPGVGYVIKHILKTGGWRRLFRDHMLSQSDSLLQTISMFWTYQEVLESLNKVEKLNEHKDFKSFMAGLVSATVPVMILHPISLLRRRRVTERRILQSYGPFALKSKHHYTNLRHLRLIFHGCASMYLHLGTLYGLRFLFFNKIREELILKPNREKAKSADPNASEDDIQKSLYHFEILLAGGIAGILGDLVAYPLDVIHSRITMPTLRRQQYPFEQTCYGVGQCIKTMLKNEGILAFYSGLWACMLKSVVYTAVQFAVYEEMKKLLEPFFPT